MATRDVSPFAGTINFAKPSFSSDRALRCFPGPRIRPPSGFRIAFSKIQHCIFVSFTLSAMRGDLRAAAFLGNAFACHPVTKLQLDGMPGVTRMVVSPCLSIPCDDGRLAFEATGRVVDQALACHSIRAFCERAAWIGRQARQTLAALIRAAFRANIPTAWMVALRCLAAAVKSLNGNLFDLSVHCLQTLAVQTHPAPALATLQSRIV